MCCAEEEEMVLMCEVCVYGTSRCVHCVCSWEWKRREIGESHILISCFVCKVSCRRCRDCWGGWWRVRWLRLPGHKEKRVAHSHLFFFGRQHFFFAGWLVSPAPDKWVNRCCGWLPLATVHTVQKIRKALSCTPSPQPYFHEDRQTRKVFW